MFYIDNPIPAAAVAIALMLRLAYASWLENLSSVSARPVTLGSSESGIYLPKDRDQVGQSARRSVGFSDWTVLIGRTGFDTISWLPDPTHTCAWYVS